MRKALNQFFGINQITPIGAGQPLIMIVGGITSPSGDMCLQACRTLLVILADNPTRRFQVEGGKLTKEGARVVLSSCEDAVATNDGRVRCEDATAGTHRAAEVWTSVRSSGSQTRKHK